MKEKFSRISVAIILLLIVVFQFAYISLANSELSTKLIAWGFRRGENNQQPTLDAEALKIVNKFDGYAMGNKEKNYVYLTFDAGYEAGYTSNILKSLKENNVTATFFITAHYLNTAEDLVLEMIKNGNDVGNHTVNHKCIAQISDEEIKEEVMKLHNAVFEKTGYEMKYFRPPKGEFSEKSLSVIKDLGYTTVMWSSAYDDWDKNKQGRTEYGKKKILDNLHNGAIILLHSTSEDNMNMLDDLLKEIKAKGYEIKSLRDFEK
ncbi:MAG: polysaccharide deacetylase family protein [Candidatus Scatovivens sp.]